MPYKTALKDPTSLFEIDEENRLVITDPLFARLFAAGYSILPSEHWSHPTHRVQMEIMQTAVKAALIKEASDGSAHVRDLMYGIDHDFSAFFASWEGTEFAELMKSIAYAQRRIFTVARRHDLNEIFSEILKDDWEFPVFPDPLTSYTFASKQFGDYPLPIQLSVEEAGEQVAQHIEASDAGLVIHLPALKARKIDPLVATDLGAKRLSEIEPSYSDFFEGQRRFMLQNYIATIHMRKDIAEKIVRRHRQIEDEWPEKVLMERSEETLRRIIASTAFTLMFSSGNQFDYIVYSDRLRLLLERRVIAEMDL